MPNKPIELPTAIDLEEFISVQAHDLRTPFNHIIGFSKMTLNTVGDAPLTDYQKEDLGTIYRSGLRALTYMNGLIDIARLNRGEKETNLADVNIQAALDHAVGQWKKFHAGENTIECKVNAASVTVKADEQLLRQVLAGFMGYVSDYCEGKVAVSVSVEQKKNRIFLTFTSAGTKARQLPELDLQIGGFVNRAMVELQKGDIRKAEETDQGAVIQFGMPL